MAMKMHDAQQDLSTDMLISIMNAMNTCRKAVMLLHVSNTLMFLVQQFTGSREAMPSEISFARGD